MSEETPEKKEVGPRAYRRSHLERLAHLSHNQCSFPGCTVNFASVDSEILVKAICHIEAAEDGGERWNPEMTNDERRRFNNLILLCPTHHTVTNDVDKYPVAAMRKIKQDHFAERKRLYEKALEVVKHPSALAEIVNVIGTSDFLSTPAVLPERKTFEIDQKIEHNRIQRNKPIIEQYRVFQGKMARLYAEIEAGGSPRKEALLHQIHTYYSQAKSKLVGGSVTVHDVADDLIDEVELMLWDLVDNKSSNLKETLDFEIRTVAIKIVMVDAFMRCKILEEPQPA